MRLLIAAMALTVMVGTALAQTAPGSQIGQHLSNAGAEGDKNKPKAKVDEKAYNAALRTIPNKQYDPWRGVR